MKKSTRDNLMIAAAIVVLAVLIKKFSGPCMSRFSEISAGNVDPGLGALDRDTSKCPNSPYKDTTGQAVCDVDSLVV